MKSASTPLSSRWRRYALCALGATVMSLFAWRGGWPLGAHLDDVAHDAGFTLRPAMSPRVVAEELPQSRDIVIVDLPHEMPRPLLARLVVQLQQARVVALDLMLVDRAAQLSADERPLFKSELVRWKREDALLASAMKRTGNVVVGAWRERSTSGQSGTQWVQPAAPFRKSARGVAHLSVIPDAQDGLIRRLQLWDEGDAAGTSRGAVPALSLEVAALGTGKTPAQLKPVADKNELWINYLGPRAVFEYQSKYVVFERALNWCEPEDFRDKLVFVGQTDFRSKDVVATPVGDLPGLLIHANATATLLDARGVPRDLAPWNVALLSLCAALLLVVPLARWTLLSCALVALGEIVALALLVALLWSRSNVAAPFSVPALSVFLTYNGVALMEYARARRTLGRVVGRAMVPRLLESRADPSLGGHEEVATAFFCDLRGFSTWAQTRSPQQLISDLNAYTAAVVSCVEEFGGRPIDFFGDGVFILFEGPNHALRGVQAALSVAEELGNAPTHLRAGVALHTGPMVIGLVGHANHLKPGVVGEAVNIAFRVQSLSDECGFSVLMTRATLESWRRDEPLRDSLFAQPIFCGAKPIKGYGGALEVFGLHPLVAVMSQKESANM